ncbi:MAG: DUF2214 family protein [Sphingomicrobium sp.]
MTGTTDLLLAIVHHLLAFGLAAVLAAEFVLTAPGLTGAGLKWLQRLDRYYGALAGLLIVIGVLRVIYGAKGPDFYLASHAFWAKMAAFAAVGLLSIAPTVWILGWGRRAKADVGYAVPAEEARALRKYFVAQIVVFASIPVFAAVMARGG